MSYYLTTSLVLGIWFFLAAVVLFKKLQCLEGASIRVLMCMVLAVVFKFNFGDSFWGLEYEDSYAFFHSADLLQRGYYPTSFLVEGIGVGSLQKPVAMVSYSGHFIMYPVFLSLFFRWLGAGYMTVAIANCFCGFLTLLFLATLSDKKNWLVAPVVYCLMPIANVFASTALSETFSSMISVGLVYSLLTSRNVCDSKFISLFAYMSFFAAIMTKRDNLILFMFPCLMFLCETWSRRCRVIDAIRGLLPYVVIVSLYMFFIQNAFAVEALDAKDIQQETFSFSNLRWQFPLFLKALIDFRYFTLIPIVVLFLLVVVSRKKLMTGKMIMPNVLFVCAVFMYAAHYRGYYFVNGLEPATTFCSFRYLNNIAFLLPVGLCSLEFRLSKKIIGGFVILLAYSLVQTFLLRTSYAHEEDMMNFSHCRDVLNYLHSRHPYNDFVLVSDRVLLYQVLCEDDLNVCDVRSVNDFKPNENSVKWYLDDMDVAVIDARYGVRLGSHRVRIAPRFKSSSKHRLNLLYEFVDNERKQEFD